MTSIIKLYWYHTDTYLSTQAAITLTNIEVNITLGLPTSTHKDFILLESKSESIHPLRMKMFNEKVILIYNLLIKLKIRVLLL